MFAASLVQCHSVSNLLHKLLITFLNQYHCDVTARNTLNTSLLFPHRPPVDNPLNGNPVVSLEEKEHGNHCQTHTSAGGRSIGLCHPGQPGRRCRHDWTAAQLAWHRVPRRRSCSAGCCAYRACPGGRACRYLGCGLGGGRRPRGATPRPTTSCCGRRCPCCAPRAGRGARAWLTRGGGGGARPTQGGRRR